VTQTRVDAVILAGGDGEIIDPTCRFKGLVQVAGKPLVEWVVDAFREARLIEEIAVVMPTAENLGGWVDKVDKLVVSDRSFMDNSLAGIRSFRGDRQVLVATGDIPLITGTAIDEFIAAALENGSDFVYPLVRRDDVEAQYPSTARTYFRLRTGSHTGGNAMVVNPALMPAARELGQQLFDQRKDAVAMLRTAGLPFVLKFVLGRLRPEDLADKIRQLLGGSGGAVVLHDAAIAIDVDKPVDLTLVERVLSQRG